MNPLQELTLNVPDTSKLRIVVVGGGFAGLNFIKSLPKEKYQVVLFDKHNYHTFQPLLYQVATAGLQTDSIAASHRDTFHNYPDVIFRMLKIISIDTVANTVMTTLGSLRYDFLVIANGMKTNFYGNAQTEKFTFPLKTIPDAINLRSQLMQIFEIAGMISDPQLQDNIMDIVIVGGGPTGVEMAGAIAELKRYVFPKDYPSLDFNKMQIYLIQSGNRLLPSMSEKSGQKAHEYLSKMGVTVLLNNRVESYDGNELTFTNKEKLYTSTVIWSAGVKGDLIPGIAAESIAYGQYKIDDTFRVHGYNNVFAIGDIAYLETPKFKQGLPGVAQVAIQMGHYLGKHFDVIVRKHYFKDVQEPLPPFTYHDKGSLATIGKGRAVANLYGKYNLSGRPAWWIWLFVHINYLISFRNKMMVFTTWIWNYFKSDKGNRLIIHPFVRKDDTVAKELLVANESQ